MNTLLVMLFLAHFVADYPLQTTWMVQAKRTWPGLALHVAVHWVTLLVVAWPHTVALSPYLLVLAICHFAIDAFKNLLAWRKPQWMVGPYLFDQLLHWITIVAVAAWMATDVPLTQLPPARPWEVYALAFLLATYVWFISERIVAYRDASYVRLLNQTLWSRMAMRALFLSLCLWGGHLLPGLAGTLVVLVPPYGRGRYGWRGLCTDVAVAVIVAFVIWPLF